MNIKFLLFIFLILIGILKSQEINITSIYNYSNSQVWVYPKNTKPSESNNYCEFGIGYIAQEKQYGLKSYQTFYNFLNYVTFSTNTSILLQMNIIQTFGTLEQDVLFKSNQEAIIPDKSVYLFSICLNSSSLTFKNVSQDVNLYDPMTNSYFAYVVFNSVYNATPPLNIDAWSNVSPITTITYAYTKLNSQKSISYDHYYKVSIVGYTSHANGEVWAIGYNLHSIINSFYLNFLLPSRTIQTLNTFKKIGIYQSSFFAYPQVMTNLYIATSTGSLSTSRDLIDDNGYTDYKSVRPLTGTNTVNPSNNTFIATINTKYRFLLNYNQTLTSSSGIYLSNWDNSDIIFYNRSNSEFINYIFTTPLKKDNLSIGSLKSTITSDIAAEHLITVNTINNIFNSPLAFPYGYGSGNLSNYNIDLSFHQYSISASGFGFHLDNDDSINNSETGLGENINYTPNISVSNIEFKTLFDQNSYNVTIDFQSTEGLLYIKIMLLPKGTYRIFHYDKLNFNYGDLYNGSINFIFENFDTESNTNYHTFNVYLYDLLDTEYHLVDGFYYTIDKIFKIPNFEYQGLDPNDFSITISNTNHNVSQVSIVDTVYINTKINYNSTLILTLKPQLDEIQFYGVWNNQQQRYEYQFKLPQNFIAYNALKFYLSLPKSNKISWTEILDSTNSQSGYKFDLKGPIFTQMDKTIQYFSQNGISKLIAGYNITIEDDINGFDFGYLVIMGKGDGSMYNFSITIDKALPGSTIYKSTYVLTFTREICVPQDYFISQLYLVDKQGLNSTFFNPTYYDYYQTTHPWSEYFDYPNYDIIHASCSEISIFETPSIKNLTISRDFIDVFSNDRNVTFTLSTNGSILEDQLPIIYLTSSVNQILKCKTNNITSNNNLFKCSMTIPSGFGYPLGILISVYSLISKDGSFVGYSSSSLFSNKISSFIAVHPNFGSYTNITTSDSSTNTPTTSSSSSNEICNKDCNGPTHGKCKNNICDCILPWYGEFCSQKIITISKPEKNETIPKTVIITNPNDETNEESISAFINVIQIREIEIDGKEYKRYELSDWKLTINDTNSNQYTYNSKIQNQDGKTTNINVTIEYFENESTITFADYPIEIKPSTVKYTISIDKYPFNSLLNSLQIILSAQVSSNDNSLCSDNLFNNNDNNINGEDYMNLKVGHLLLFGRFIKRAFIDNNHVSLISNKMIDDDSTGSNSNSNSNTKSLIAIELPHYSDTIIVDPDYAILLDRTPASSVCQSKGLTGSQIAGIVIGGVCFVGITISISVYIYYKNKQKKLFHSKLKNIELKNK